ncbi:hypothetical protein LLG95_14395 [bacterium]|nr:hypothetical protein [bacterium]
MQLRVMKEDIVRQPVFDRILEQFKSGEQPESVLMVVGNAALIRIILCWAGVEIKRVGNPKTCKATGDEARWAWLWSKVTYSRDDLLARIPGAGSRTGKALDALIASRILYPDGTINSYVQRYLHQRTLQVFGASLGKKSGNGARLW